MFSFLKKNRVWIKNFSSGVLNRFVTILSQIALVPLFINTWGKEYYGEWLLISTLPAYLTASDFGINVTATNEICRLIAQKKIKEALLLYKSANTALILLSILILSILIFSFIIIDWKEVMGVNLVSKFDLELGLFFLVITVLISFLLGLAIGIYRAENKYNKTLNSLTVLQLLELISIITNLYQDGNILSIAISNFVIRLIFTVAIIINLKNSFNWYHFGISKNIQNIIHLLPTSMYYMAAFIGQGITMQGTSFIIGKSLGPSSLVTFNTVRTLTNSIKSLISVYYSTFLPNFTVMIARFELKKAKQLYNRMILSTLIITILFIVFYYLTGKFILIYWTNNSINLNYTFYLLMLTSIFFNTLGNCSFTLLTSINENKKIGVYGTVIAICSLVSIYYFSTQGINYIAGTLMASELLLTIIIFKESWSVLNNFNFHN